MKELRKVHNTKPLSSLEYSGLENLLCRIISAYEDYAGIPAENQTPVSEIIRRTDNGIEIFDGAYDLYVIEDFAVKNLFTIGNTCVMAGLHTEGKDIEEYFDNEPDILIDVTPFLDMQYIDIDWLIGKISETK